MLKCLLALLLLIGFYCNSNAQNLDTAVPTTTINGAINTLKATKVIYRPMDHFGATNAFENEHYLYIYDSQTNAIAVLAKAKIPETASLLIPYLDYPSRDYMSLRAYDHPMEDEVTNDTLSVWPTLHALTQIPDSGHALSDYILNTNNPVELRLTAFHALRYVDRKQLKSIGDKLTAEFSNSQRARSFISIVQEEKCPLVYCGTEEVHGISK